MSSDSGPARTARHIADRTSQTGQEVENSRGFGVFILVGLVIYGVVHLLLAWIILQLAWSGGSGQQASTKGALSELADGGFGSALLWVAAVGLFALAVWQVFQACWGYREIPRAKRFRRRAGSVGRAVVYLAIGASAASIATGSSGGVSSGGGASSDEQPITARLMANTWGRVLVALIGIAIIAVGVGLIYRGLAKRFTEDLQGSRSATALRFGQIGYTAKGAVLILVGVLFGWAGISYDPAKAGGLDMALRTLRNQPFGPVMLTIVAAGLVCFGLYCFAWSRHAKH